MKILAVTRYLSPRGGGLPAAILRLYECLASKGVDVVLVAGDAPDSVPNQARVVLYRSIGLQSFGYSRDLLQILDREGPDVVHLHGLWTYASIVCGSWQQRTGKPLVVSPHGMVDKWALNHRGLKKRIAGALYEWRNLRNATRVHALSDGEVEALSELGLSDNVVKIPNGIDLAKPSDEQLSSNRKNVLFVGRLHPKKGLIEVITAWSLVTHRLRESGAWQLLIAGWDDGGHEAILRKMVKMYGLESEITFLGPVFGADKDKLYADAGAVILASYSEGLPMSVLEAWSFGKPVFMTRNCNLPEGFNAGAAFEITTDPENIADVLFHALSNPNILVAAGHAGRVLAGQAFDWSNIADRWYSLYSSLLADMVWKKVEV